MTLVGAWLLTSISGRVLLFEQDCEQEQWACSVLLQGNRPQDVLASMGAKYGNSVY